MNKAKALLRDISVIYFNDESKNIYADLFPNKEQAKRLAGRIYKDVMIVLSAPKTKDKSLAIDII